MSFAKIVENLRYLIHPTAERFSRATFIEQRFLEAVERGDHTKLTDDEIQSLATALELPRDSKNYLRFVRAAATAAYLAFCPFALVIPLGAVVAAVAGTRFEGGV